MTSGAAVDLLAVRKAAVLARWVPGISLAIGRDGGPTVLVTDDDRLSVSRAMERIDPDRFRRQLAEAISGHDTTVGRLLGLGRHEVHIGVITAPGTVLDDNGLVVAALDDDQSVLGFVTVFGLGPGLAADRPVDDGPGRCDWIGDEVPIVEDPDDALGMTMVSCRYRTDDARQSVLAYEAMLDAMVASGVEEVTGLSW